MDKYEEYYEEVSDNKVEPQEEEVGVVALMPVEIPLEVQVGPVADNLASPSPSPQTPSPPVPSPLQVSPVGDATSFMGFYTHDDVVELEQWTVNARAARTNPAIRIEEPEVSPNLKVFLRFTLGAQGEVKLVREPGEVLIEQMRTNLAGYNQMTSFNRRQWLRLFPAWTAQERREQLEMLADAGGFWVIYVFGPFLRVARSFSAGGPFVCLVPPSMW